MSILNILLIIAMFLTGFFALVLGLFSLYRNPRSEIVQAWFLFCVIAAFVPAVGLLAIFANSESQAIFFYKLLHFGNYFVPLLLYVFVIKFLHLKFNRYVFYTSLLLSVVFGFLSFTNLIVSGVQPLMGFKYWPNSGSLFLFAGVYFGLLVVYSFVKLLTAYFRTDGIIKYKIKFVLIALLLMSGASTGQFPQLFGIYPFGFFYAWTFSIFITYGIFKN